MRPSSILSEIVRVALDVLLRIFIGNVRDPVWIWLQFFGSLVVSPFTLGKVWLADKHPVAAGNVGLAVHVGLLIWLIKCCLRR